MHLNPRPAFKRSVGVAFLLVAAACFFDVASFAQEQAHVLKFGYILGSSSQLGQGEQIFAQDVFEKTAGRYRVENYPNAMLGGEVSMLRDLQLGAIDVAFITGAALPNVVPSAGVFDIPFLFDKADDARRVLDGPIGDSYLAAFDRVGLKALAWGENGTRHLTNSSHPILSPDDLKGLKLRLPQSDVMTIGFTALGAQVEQIPFPDLFAALGSGRVDGQENPIATILSGHFALVQRYLSLTAHIYDPAVIVMSAETFDSLSEDDKRVFREAARAAARISREVASRAERDGVAALEANGMIVSRTVDKAAFVRSSAAAMPVFEKAFGADAIRNIQEAAKQGPSPSGSPLEREP